MIQTRSSRCGRQRQAFLLALPAPTGSDPVAVAFSARETTLERLMAQDRVKRSLFSPDFNPWVEVLGGRGYRLAGVPHRVGEATDCSIQQAEEDEFQ